MTTEHTPGGLIGRSVRRVEDPVLITGKGCYVDDIQLPGMLHMAFLRSPYPHAKILSIQTSAAQAMPGVVAVVTGDDLSERLHVPVMPLVPGMKIPPHPLLARGAVHAAGVPVAAVVAHSRALAQDAANAIEVEYAALPVVVNAEKALEPGAPLAREELDSNICYTTTKQGGDVDRAFAEAEHIVRLRIASPRLVALTMEPRGVLAKPEPTGDLTVWLSTQSPHLVRADLATAIGFPEHRIRVIAPDVGGGFGSKATLYQDEALACHLALRLGRPIKWIATRSEDFLTTNQGRDQVMTSELALKRDGTMLGLKVRVVANLGAYLQAITAIPPLRMMGMAPGCYQIRNCHVEVIAVLTNTVSTGPYRGAGRPEAVLNIERLIDKAARDLGLDRLEIRRKNFIRPDQFPYRTGVNVEYDSGDYEKSLAEALRLSDYDQMMQYRDAAQARGELVGVGISTFVEPSGGVGFESATVRVERTGEITVLTGASSHGQGHETVFAQVVADQLRVAMEHVAIRHGDTLAIQQGVGTFASRSAVMGGGALALATQRVIDKHRPNGAGRRGAARRGRASLRVVANFAVGYDNVDVAACRERGVIVTNTPDVLTNATAELAVALMLAAARRLGEAERIVRAGRWTGWEPGQLLGRELSGAWWGSWDSGASAPASPSCCAGSTSSCCTRRARRIPKPSGRLGARARRRSTTCWRARTS